VYSEVNVTTSANPVHSEVNVTTSANQILLETYQKLITLITKSTYWDL
jgi:hypothetical protein